MDIALLIIGIIIIILIVILILKSGNTNTDDIKIPDLDLIKSQLEMMQKENRDSQSYLRRQISRIISHSLTVSLRQVRNAQEMNRSN